MSNQIMAIKPYWDDNLQTWVFDDAKVGLEREPFVSGADVMITDLVSDIPNARKGFRALFSASAFPESTEYWRKREENGGHWYLNPDTKSEGWLCPALFKYFKDAPPILYVKAEALA